MASLKEREQSDEIKDVVEAERQYVEKLLFLRNKAPASVKLAELQLDMAYERVAVFAP